MTFWEEIKAEHDRIGGYLSMDELAHEEAVFALMSGDPGRIANVPLDVLKAVDMSDELKPTEICFVGART